MDDVLYLRKHADEESFLFVADSSRRDTAVYPQPNEYQINFHSPFRNVVGLDLIDATVPRTEYLVEEGHNALVYTQHGTKHTATVAPGDYNILQLLEALNAALAPRLQVAVSSTPPEVSNKVHFLSEAPFVVHVAESTLRRHLGLGVAAHLSADTQVPGILGTQTLVTGPLPSVATVSLGSARRQAITSSKPGTPVSVALYVTSGGAVAIQAAVVTATGQLVAQGTAHTSGQQFEQLVVPLDSDAQAVEAGTPMFVVVQGAGAAIFCDDESNSQVSTAQGSASPGGPWWSYASWTAGVAAMCLDVSQSVDGYQLQPPGVVDLTGEPYVLVRCPEIEQQLYRDRAFEAVHAGMGLVKLGNYGFREQRFDFTSFPPRKLPTPIGKLSKLTIRLEKADGTLYDTKGINHHLVLVIRYLELNKGPESMQSTLNPHYLPNPLHYLQRQA